MTAGPAGPPPPAGPGSRRLVLLLLILAAVLAVLPVLIARSRPVQLMRADLTEVLAACRARYEAARTAADTVEADAWQPPLQGARRPHDPTCGPYRRRNMLAGARR